MDSLFFTVFVWPSRAESVFSSSTFPSIFHFAICTFTMECALGRLFKNKCIRAISQDRSIVKMVSQNCHKKFTLFLLQFELLSNLYNLPSKFKNLEEMPSMENEMNFLCGLLKNSLSRSKSKCLPFNQQKCTSV